MNISHIAEHVLSPVRLSALGIVLLAAGIGLTGCGRGTVSQAKKYLVYDREPGSDEGEYVLSEEKIETLDNLQNVEGAVARMRVGGNMEQPIGSPSNRQEFKNSMKITGAKTPNADYEIRPNGLVVPWDFDSTMMFTLYHHLETAKKYFNTHGVDAQTMGKVPVYYNTSVQALLPIDQLTNNAAYVFTLDAFLIPPSILDRKVPLAANRGVMVHEYSHLVFNRLVHRDKRVPDYLLSWSGEPRRLMDSINEGVADTFAALQTGESNFIGVSLSENQIGMSRDLANPTYEKYTSALRQCVESPRNCENVDDNYDHPCGVCGPNDIFQYNPYVLGSHIASVAWAIKEETGVTDGELSKAVVGALRDMGDVAANRSASDFDVPTYFNAVHAELPADDQKDACRILTDRLEAVRGQLTCEP